MRTQDIQLTFTQCKQIADNTDLREFVDEVNDQPQFMSGEMGVHSISELQALIQCGCAANAHASVFYYQASQYMADHGDEVLEYIEQNLGDLPELEKGISWSQVSTFYLSCAIELWCGQFADSLNNVNWD